MNITHIDYHPYQLTFSNHHLGSVAKGSFRKGALLRIQFENKQSYGYGCIHPWEELGDKNLAKQLEHLTANKPTPLIKQAIHCAYADSVARENNLALHISDQLKNHALCELTHPNISAILEQKKQLTFKIIKIKVGQNWKKEREVWHQLTQRFPHFKWRLDFNERLSTEQFNETIKWVKNLGLNEYIDFFEDPICISSNLETLKNYQGPIKIAIDRNIQLLSQLNPDNFVGVIKPAIDDDAIIESLLKDGYQLSFTSYLDHPVGQAWASYQASNWKQQYPKQLLTAGLLSHSAYQSNDFSAELSSTPYWKASKQAGLGFGSLLNQLSWIPLNS